MEAVFVDINLEKAGFLHVSDIAESQIRGTDGQITQVPIQQILREGKDILVQVTKDPMGLKVHA
jgi:ribonuclease G